MATHYLACDLGASSGRAILATLDNGNISLQEVHRFVNGPIEKDGSLFWDFDSICNEIKTGLKKALEVNPEISSIAVDTWGVDYVLVQPDDTLARLPYHYRDSRTDNIRDEVFAKISEKQVYSVAGIQYMQLNTLFQLAVHMKTHPEDFADATFLTMPDALTWMLCGKKACEYTNATTTQLLNAETKDWYWELIDAIGVPRDIFPAVEMPGTTAGTLRPELQEEFGCGPIKVAHVGSHDTASAVASVPAPMDKTWAYISCGTWALLGAELDSPLLSGSARKANYTNEGGLAGKITFLTNIMGTWLLQETRRVWNEAGRNISFPEMAEMAKSAKPMQFLLNPNHQKFLAPGNMPESIREFCRETGQGDIPDDAAVLRCIYDSLALCFKAKITDLENILGVKYDCLNIVGGAVKDKFLMQHAANAAGIPVLAGPDEATSIGNVIGQAMADGDVADLAAGRDIVRKSCGVEEFTPASCGCVDMDAALEKFNSLP